MNKSIVRAEVSEEALLKAIEIVVHNVGRRVEKHGNGAFTSKHEALGVFAEEWTELNTAVKDDTSLQPFVAEAVDMAVVGIFTLASAIAATSAVVEPEEKKVAEVALYTPDIPHVDPGIHVFDPYERSLSDKG